MIWLIVDIMKRLIKKQIFLSLKFALRGGCTGGKGGFGSLLRSAKSVKKTTNYGSCRDLHGRRLRDVQNERRLSEWSEKEKEMKKEDILVQEEKEEKGVSLNSKERLDVQTKVITNSVVNSVEKGLALLKEKEQKRKREEDRSNSSFKLFGMEDDISDSESEKEGDVKEQKKKRHCPESRTTITINSTTTTTTTTSTPSPPRTTTTTTTTVHTSLKMGPPAGSKRTAENVLDY